MLKDHFYFDFSFQAFRALTRSTEHICKMACTIEFMSSMRINKSYLNFRINVQTNGTDPQEKVLKAEPILRLFLKGVFFFNFCLDSPKFSCYFICDKSRKISKWEREREREINVFNLIYIWIGFESLKRSDEICVFTSTSTSLPNRNRFVCGYVRFWLNNNLLRDKIFEFDEFIACSIE